MRTKQRQNNYSETARESVRRDFSQQIYRQKPVNRVGNIDQRRIIYISEHSGYFKFRSCILGKLVKLISYYNSIK